jgi:FAD/FMN-containing dehydrogenase
MRAHLEAHRIEARFDLITRTLYATDASNHQIMPLGVAFPRDREEVSSIVAQAAALELPVLPRGAGTSLGGQAVGACLVLDTARHLDRIRSIEPDGATAVVEPGVVCQTLNAAAAGVGLQYGPDPASADRATFGGMLGNNATGAHSIRYGMSSDHVLRATYVVGDGSLIEFTSVAPEEAARKARGDSIQSAAYRTALQLRSSLPPLIDRRWPRTWRRASGYGLNYLTGQSFDSPQAWFAAPRPYMDPTSLNLPAALCGSEGTLGVLVEAEVRLVPRPRATALLLLSFESVADACTATVGLLESSPSAIELVPASLLERARAVPAYARRLGFLEAVPKALLAVEFEGESPAAAATAARRAGMRGTLLEDPTAQAGFWEVRRAGLGLLISVPGDVKPNTFIEDVAVPIVSLPEYVRRVDAILAEYDTFGEWYAHASAGCLHLRPMLNLKTSAGRQDMRQIADAIVDVVCELRGAVSGEHGDGLSHTGFNERLFGPELIDAFRAWKRAFDPKGILNPGKVVVAEGASAPAIDGAMRYRPDYGPTIDLAPTFAYRREHSLLQALESCGGVGVCRKAGGIMCPSFQATREEADSTRGRANILRAAMTGSLPPKRLSPRAASRPRPVPGMQGLQGRMPDGGRHGIGRVPGALSSRHGTLSLALLREIARVQERWLLAVLQNAVGRTRLFRRFLPRRRDRLAGPAALQRRPFHSEVPISGIAVRRPGSVPSSSILSPTTTTVSPGMRRLASSGGEADRWPRTRASVLWSTDDLRDAARPVRCATECRRARTLRASGSRSSALNRRVC